MIRVVFDTNVLFSAALKRTGIPTQIVNLIADGVLTPCVSDAIIAEYHDVLTRPIRRPYADRVRELLAWMTQFAIHVTSLTKLFFCSDPADEPFLECAVAAGAAYLVTGNLRHFPKGYQPVAIVTPRELRQRLVGEAY